MRLVTKQDTEREEEQRKKQKKASVGIAAGGYINEYQMMCVNPSGSMPSSGEKHKGLSTSTDASHLT